MAISSYSELVTAIGNWMARTDLNDRIPEFIALAEAKMNRELMCRQMDQRATTSVDTSTDEPEYVTLPTDVQTLRRVSLTSVTGQPELQYLSPIQLNDMRYRWTGDTVAQPCYYTFIGDELELLPVPDQDYELELVYRKNLPALDGTTNTTNWLLTLAPDVYLYGALREAAIFMQEDERVALWAQGYASAVDSINRLSGQFHAGPSTISLPGPTP